MSKTPMQEYEDFWKGILEDENGNINKEQLAKELADYSMILGEVGKVYDHITGGKCSKPNTVSGVVCSLADEHYEEIWRENIAEEIAA